MEKTQENIQKRVEKKKKCKKRSLFGMKIHLIRHSESIDDIENCYGGIADFDLTENGKDKVILYRKETDNYGIEKVYTSPYKRAYQTAVKI